MTLTIEVFWSFRSPYSYLATPRLNDLALRYDVDIRVRPVYPLAVRAPDFFRKQNRRWPGYVAKDALRIAQMLGVPFGPPRPDPIVMNFATGEVAREQPYIRRLTHLGQAAVERGRGLAFIAEVSRVIWGGDVAGWDAGEHLARAAMRAGLDFAVLERMIDTQAARIETAIQASHVRLEEVGHWGVPTMVFHDEPFFGQDRIDALLWRMRQHGLQDRLTICAARALP